MTRLKNGEQILPRKDPTDRPHHTNQITWAFRALAEGEADERQQKLVLDYLLNAVAGTYDRAFRPESARVTDFVLGKQHVGQTIVLLLNTADTTVDIDEKAARHLKEEQR